MQARALKMKARRDAVREMQAPVRAALRADRKAIAEARKVRPALLPDALA